MLPKDKIKSIDYLFNRIITEMFRGNGDSKYSLLLGAGCSVSSGIETASGIVDMLKSIAYLREQPTQKNNSPFLRLKSGMLIPFLKEWHENNKEDAGFVSFVETHQNKVKDKIREEFSQSDGYYKEVFSSLFFMDHPDFDALDAERQHEILAGLLEENINKVTADRMYSYWFEQYSTASEDIHSFLTELMNNKNPSEAYIFLADLFVNNMFSIAFTTNFDNLLGESLSLLGVRSKEILFDASGIDNALSKTSPNIIKLHGDYMYNNTKNLSRETRELSKPLQRQMENVLSKNGLVVIGYSGSDNSIMYALERISEKYSFPLFWCETRDKIEGDAIHWRTRELVCRSENAYFIPIDSFDSLVEKLRRNYLYYAQLRENLSGDKDEKPLYNKEYLKEALERIKRIIDKVIDQNDKITYEVNPVPAPWQDLQGQDGEMDTAEKKAAVSEIQM